MPGLIIEAEYLKSHVSHSVACLEQDHPRPAGSFRKCSPRPRDPIFPLGQLLLGRVGIA